MCAAVDVSLSIGNDGGHGGDRPTVAVAASCDPPDVATGPAARCPPVCQGSKQFAEQSAQHDAEQPDHNGNHLLASRFRNCADDRLVR